MRAKEVYLMRYWWRRLVKDNLCYPTVDICFGLVWRM